MEVLFPVLFWQAKQSSVRLHSAEMESQAASRHTSTAQRSLVFHQSDQAGNEQVTTSFPNFALYLFVSLFTYYNVCLCYFFQNMEGVRPRNPLSNGSHRVNYQEVYVNIEDLPVIGEQVTNKKSVCFLVAFLLY